MRDIKRTLFLKAAVIATPAAAENMSERIIAVEAKMLNQRTANNVNESLRSVSMKTKLWIVLVFILIISCCAEAETIVASGAHGSNLTWTLDSNGTLTIAGEGEMTDFSSEGTYDWRGSDIVSRTTSIVIEEGVTSVGAYAFKSFENLSSVTMADSVALLGERAFAVCTRLATVEMSQNIQSIGNSCFSECRALTKVDFYPSLRTIGDYAFYVCHQLTTADLPEGLVTIGKGAFDSCDKLASVVIPSTVTTIGDYAFDGCHAIKEVTIPSTVTSLGSYVFSNCIEMETAVVEEGITSLPNSTFNNCHKLGTVSLPSTLIYIGPYAFNTGYYGTTYPMTTVVIPDKVTEIGNYAFNCQTSLTSITLSAELKTIGLQAFGRCLALTEVTIPTGAESIGSAAFFGSSSLNKVTIPRSVTSIGASAFGDCPNVTIYCYENSAAHAYAVENALSFVLIHDPSAPTLTLLPDYDQNVYLGMPVYYSGLGSDGDLPYGGLDGLWSEVKNYNDMKAYYGDEPEWSYSIPEDAPFTVMETGSWENSFNLWPSFDMPASPADVPVTITCKWGGQTAATTVTLHYVNLPNGIMPTDHDGPTEVHLKVGDTLIITGDAVNGGWNSDNTIFTMPLTPIPSGWGIPNWTNHVVLFDEQMEAFAEADPNNRMQSSKTFTITKAGTFIATVMLSADTVYMGHNVVFYVEKDGVTPPPVLDISGPDVMYFVGEGLVLSDTPVLNQPYTGSFLLNRIMSDDAGYAAILSGDPTYTAVCDDPDIQFRCVRDGRWCELYLDALPNGTKTVTFTITCDWDGAHGETEAKVSFVKIPMPTGLFREADHQAPPSSLTVKTYDRLTAIDRLHLANDYVVDDDANGFYFERGMWYNEGDEDAEDPFSVFVDQGNDFFRIAGKPGTYDITLSSSSANIAWTQECRLVIEDRPILTLPAAVTEIESQAFAGTAAEVIIIPKGCRSIAGDAFDECPSLACIINRSDAAVNAPDGVTVIKE